MTEKPEPPPKPPIPQLPEWLRKTPDQRTASRLDRQAQRPTPTPLTPDTTPNTQRRQP
ncbi:hypothetical protein [Rhodococcus koreensis]|uniref:hypothetical protein n=1 Tax=Rhodococcus koreensis TaxID=99653 RepID=UPI0036D93262